MRMMMTSCHCRACLSSSAYRSDASSIFAASVSVESLPPIRIVQKCAPSSPTSTCCPTPAVATAFDCDDEKLSAHRHNLHFLNSASGRKEKKRSDGESRSSSQSPRRGSGSKDEKTEAYQH